MAVLTSQVALSIDAMLPALPSIGHELAVAVPNHNQYVITVFFLGFATGQLFYGPISDSIGRKPVIYAGLLLFIAGCLISVAATDYSHMLLGRALQGFGAAGPRTVTIAMIRDKFAGRAMARVMSFVMAVFIIVPALAPSIGQGVLAVANWRAIFLLFLLLAAIGFFWLSLRQPETLLPGDRRPLSLKGVFASMLEAFKNRVAASYIITAGMVFGAFVGYLTSSQQIFDIVYDKGHLFPVLFAMLAVNLGIASLVNSQLVMRFGMRMLSARALNMVTLLSVIFLAVALVHDGAPPLWTFMAYAMITFFFIGILFGNLVALAMEPLGHIAGAGSAVVGAATTFISLLIGGAIGQSFNGTVLPMVIGFALLSIVGYAVMRLGGGKPADQPA